jgi:hypothetical protein
MCLCLKITEDPAEEGTMELRMLTQVENPSYLRGRDLEN